ncbi:hypothetical protein BGX26_012043, partial [Mortierella sp. AD094]
TQRHFHRYSRCLDPKYTLFDEMASSGTPLSVVEIEDMYEDDPDEMQPIMDTSEERKEQKQKFLGTCSLQPPANMNMSQKWKYIASKIAPDSLRSMSITIDHIPLNDLPDKVFIKVGSSYILDMATDGDLRLRLQKPFEFKSAVSGHLAMNPSFEGSCDSNFELNYVEMEVGTRGLQDHMIYGENAPKHVIDVGFGLPKSSTSTAKVLHYGHMPQRSL